MYQHFISRVILRRFTCPPRGHIGVIDLEARTSGSGSVRDLGGLADFVRAGADRTERKWAQTEQRLPHAFKLIAERKILEDQKFSDAIRDCIALHYARSMATAVLHNKVLSEQLPEYGVQAGDRLLERFPPERVVYELTGLYVPPMSAEPLARWLIQRHFVNAVSDGTFTAEVLLENYERGRELVAQRELEFWHSDNHEFILGDVPVATVRRESHQVGLLNGVRWGDADAIVMPLGPHDAVALAHRPGYHDADAHLVEYVNAKQVQGALRHVFFRLGSGLDRVIISALNKSSPPP